MSTWQATNDRLFVVRDNVEERTPGGIILSRGSQERPLFGIVISVGPKCTIEAGSRVIFGKYSGSDITIDGQEVKILREEEVLATSKGA